MTTRLVLIRHGITEWNKDRRYCGCKDVSLSRQGRLQAAKLRKRFNKSAADFDKIYCSDRKRALQTRAIIFGRSEFIRLNGLREINFGVFEGLKHEEIMEKFPAVYRRWLADPYKARIPQAEHMRVFKKRVQNAIKKILQANSGKTIAVVCHGGVIGILVSGILKSRDFWKYVPSAASLTIVEHKDNKFRIKKFNDKRHLG
ncbi:MAG: histidine phosphatase family protein [Candidatus Omnitrophica bacterium]|nr:histidine phosphatase family protein [Candidatus Omnitrophota bacterium]